MGIRGLVTAIKKNSQHLYKIKKLSDYSKKIIAIDSEILVYKFKSYSNKQTEFDPNYYHLYAFLNNAMTYLKNDIIPVYIFDGGSKSIAKQNNCLAKRYEIKEKALLKIDLLESKFLEKQEKEDKDPVNKYLANNETFELLAELAKIQNNNIIITKEYRNDCKKFLRLLGLPVIDENGEAEVVSVKLVKNGLADYVLSEDSDCIVYALSVDKDIKKDVPILKKNESSNDIQEILPREVLDSFQLEIHQFVDYCILSGCDYCPTVPRIGPVTALKIIKEHKTIEDYNKISKLPENFTYEEARNIFFEPNVSIENLEPFVIKRLNQEREKELQKFLEERNIGSLMTKCSKCIGEYFRDDNIESIRDIRDIREPIREPIKISIKHTRYTKTITVDMFRDN